MQTTLKQLKKIARGMHLSAEEKSTMRGEIFQYMEAHPVRNPIRPRHLLMKKRYGSISSPFFIINKFKSKFRRASTHRVSKDGMRHDSAESTARHDFAKSTMPILIILGLLMGGSVSFAAENALPGDTLFPVKVYVNENVRGAVAVTEQAKAEWDVHLVERRLKEVEKLAVDGTASSDAKDIAQSNLEKYTTRAKERISKFEDENDNEDAFTTTEQLTEVLRTHETILANLGVSQTITGGVMASTTLVTTTGSVIDATSTAGVINGEENLSSINDALKTLHEVREYSEHKNKEIEGRRSSMRGEKHKENSEDPLSINGTETVIPAFNNKKKEGGRKIEISEREGHGNSHDKEEEFHTLPMPPVLATTTDSTLSTTTSTTTVNTLPYKVEDENDSSKDKDSKNPFSETRERDHN